MFSVISHDSALEEMTNAQRNLLAVVVNANDKTLLLQYGKLIGQSLYRYILEQNDKGQLARAKMLKQDVYEFLEDISTDTVLFFSAF